MTTMAEQDDAQRSAEDQKRNEQMAKIKEAAAKAHGEPKKREEPKTPDEDPFDDNNLSVRARAVGLSDEDIEKYGDALQHVVEFAEKSRKPLDEEGEQDASDDEADDDEERDEPSDEVKKLRNEIKKRDKELEKIKQEAENKRIVEEIESGFKEHERMFAEVIGVGPTKDVNDRQADNRKRIVKLAQILLNGSHASGIKMKMSDVMKYAMYAMHGEHLVAHGKRIAIEEAKRKAPTTSIRQTGPASNVNQFDTAKQKIAAQIKKMGL